MASNRCPDVAGEPILAIVVSQPDRSTRPVQPTRHCRSGRDRRQASLAAFGPRIRGGALDCIGSDRPGANTKRGV